MYIRFTKRTKTKKQYITHKEVTGMVYHGKPIITVIAEPIERYTLAIQIVETKRINGKPRQKILAHLGIVSSDDLTSPHTQLWDSARKKFTELGLDATTQERLLQQIARKLAPS